MASALFDWAGGSDPAGKKPDSAEIDAFLEGKMAFPEGKAEKIGLFRYFPLRKVIFLLDMPFNSSSIRGAHTV